ncbi:MAG: hypothetical protein ACOYJZ_04555 [Acutalibacter sp.]
MPHTTLVRQAVEESAVLLKNQGLLPFAPGQTLAVFGRTQYEPVLSGNGSGASYGKNRTSFLAALEEAGVRAVPALKETYARLVEEDKKNLPPEIDFTQMKHAVTRGLMYEMFGKYAPASREFSSWEELLD